MCTLKRWPRPAPREHAAVSAPANAPWTAGAAEAIGVNWLLGAIAPHGMLGRRARTRERAFRRGDEAAARRQLAGVERVARERDAAWLEASRARLAALTDPLEPLARARSGGVLSDSDLFELSSFAEALTEAGIQSLLASSEHTFVPALATELQRLLAPGRTSAGGFYLDDAFDEELARARVQSARCEAAYDAARSHLAQRVAHYAGVEHVREGEFVLLRERVVGPLPAEIRVLREAPTYLLCELALDEDSQAALAAREDALERVAEREEAVRLRLSLAIAEMGPVLEAACNALGELELHIARALFAQRYGCVVPEVLEASSARFEAARCLPLAETLERHGRAYTPISLELTGMGIVTGPNMGGKTAALRTLGFLTACVALGVPVPADSAALPLVDEIAWLGGANETPQDGLLSSFGAEIVELRELLSHRAGRALLLIDEFARTTSPREGRALLVALLECLSERDAFGLAATHLAGLSREARVAHYAIGGRGVLASRGATPLPLETALARIAQEMDYRLVQLPEGAAPASDALALADALGLDTALVARAREIL